MALSEQKQSLCTDTGQLLLQSRRKAQIHPRVPICKCVHILSHSFGSSPAASSKVHPCHHNVNDMPLCTLRIHEVLVPHVERTRECEVCVPDGKHCISIQLRCHIVHGDHVPPSRWIICFNSPFPLISNLGFIWGDLEGIYMYVYIYTYI